MQTTLVMTVIGPDRTGLVESVARLVAEHGGNWLESRMCRLGGEFAGIVRIAVPKAQRPALEAALGKLPGLTTVVRGDEPVREPPKQCWYRWKSSGRTDRASCGKSRAR